MLSLISGISWFIPKITVSPANSLDNSNPFLTPFTISNDGYLSIYDVQFMCAVKEIKGINMKTKIPLVISGAENFKSKMHSKFHVAEVIAPNEKYTQVMPLPNFFLHYQIKHADIAILVSFRPIKWFPLKKEKNYRFITAQNINGHLQWYPQPIKK